MKVISIQLETCHANGDGDAWYAYITGHPTKKEVKKILKDFEANPDKYEDALEDGGCLEFDFEVPADPEEVPNNLSRGWDEELKKQRGKGAGLTRWYFGAAG